MDTTDLRIARTRLGGPPRRLMLGAAVPALALALSLLPALSPATAAEDEVVFGPEMTTECTQAVEQASAAGGGTADGDTVGYGDNTDQCANPPQEPAGAARPDGDGDGLYDDDELYVYYTNPWAWDTDGDGAGDGEEVYYGTDPNW